MIVAATDVQAITAVAGVLVAILSLVLNQLQRRPPTAARDELERRIAELEERERSGVEAAEDTAAEQRVREEVEQKREEARQDYVESVPARSTRSYKAIAALVLGVIAIAGQFGEDPSSSDYPSSDIVVGVIFYGLLAIVFGVSALRDMKKDPTRRGRRMAIGGIVAAVVAFGLLAALSAAAGDDPDTGPTGATGVFGFRPAPPG